MAITKILAKNSRLDVLIRYVTNQDKTEEQVLTAYLNCDPGHAYQQMMDTIITLPRPRTATWWSTR